MRFVGTPVSTAYKQEFRHYLDRENVTLMYHRESSWLHARVHFPRLSSVRDSVFESFDVVGGLCAVGFETLFPVRVARVDVTGDVLFARPDLYTYAESAFLAMLPAGRREVSRFKTSVYLHSTESKGSKRLGRVYDKGHERAQVGDWKMGKGIWMRIEAEQVYGPRKPLLDDLTSDLARKIFLDRFGGVGKGLGLLKGNLVDPLMRLLSEGVISPAKYESLYTFLDHCRMGLADRLYADNRKTQLRRAAECRELGLEVPGMEGRSTDDILEELDVRALVEEIAVAL